MCFICGCKHMQHTGYDKFGRPARKGTIDYRSSKKQREQLQSMLHSASHNQFFTSNLSYKKFRNDYGEASSTDPHLQDGVYEWKRKIKRPGTEEIICCPEDVRRTPYCKHDEETVCSKCEIPICNDCWYLGISNEKIPKALACDNFIGYAHKFLVDTKVTWLEATIAAPVFSGLVTYYIEGAQADRHNMMDSSLAKARRSWGVRGNLFSFLLPWEKVLQQLYEKVERGDLAEWPLSPSAVCQVVRVRFVRGPTELLEQFRFEWWWSW